MGKPRMLYRILLPSLMHLKEVAQLEAICWERNRGNALDELELYEDAVSSYDKALEISPSSRDVLSNKAVALGNLGRYEEALKCCNKALEIDSLFGAVWYNKGLALEALCRNDDAATAFARASELGYDGPPKEAVYYNDRRLQDRPL